jgi:hypothetical protein
MELIIPANIKNRVNITVSDTHWQTKSGPEVASLLPSLLHGQTSISLDSNTFLAKSQNIDTITKIIVKELDVPAISAAGDRGS